MQGLYACERLHRGHANDRTGPKTFRVIVRVFDLTRSCCRARQVRPSQHLEGLPLESQLCLEVCLLHSQDWLCTRPVPRRNSCIGRLVLSFTSSQTKFRQASATLQALQAVSA